MFRKNVQGSISQDAVKSDGDFLLKVKRLFLAAWACEDFQQNPINLNLLFGGVSWGNVFGKK
ncbi:MAG: hypothetical protein U1F16_06570 [Turneriella sp.]